MTPSDTSVIDRVQHFARLIVDEQMRRMKEHSGLQYLDKLLGIYDADYAESLPKKPETQISAILMYLEELAIERK